MALLGSLAASAIGLLAAFSWQLGPARASELSNFVAEKAAVAAMLQAKTQRAVATIAQDRLVLTYAVATRDDVKQALKAKIERLLLNVSPGLLAEEVAIVTTDGKPLTRVLRGRVNDESEIDEDDSAVIEPARHLEAGTVYASPVYRSPDTGEWALSYAAPIGDGGEPYAILHVQQNLKRKLDIMAMRPAAPGVRWYVVEDRARIIFDSASGAAKLSDAAAGQSADQYFRTFSIGELSLDNLTAELGPFGVGLVSVEGTLWEVALSAVDRWTIVALMEPRSQ